MKCSYECGDGNDDNNHNDDGNVDDDDNDDYNSGNNDDNDNKDDTDDNDYGPNDSNKHPEPEKQATGKNLSRVTNFSRRTFLSFTASPCLGNQTGTRQS